MLRKYGYLTIIFMFILTSCTKPGEETEVAEPAYQEDASVNIVKNEVVLYVDTNSAKGIGDLYIKKNNEDKEKIASNVLRGQFEYLYNTKAALYLDKDNNLYIKESGKAEEQISTDVFPDSIEVSKDESTILFLKSQTAKDYSAIFGDLYSVVRGKEKEKISSAVKANEYSITDDGKVITFQTEDGSLYRKSADVTDKEKLGSDVISFNSSPDGSLTIFENKENSIYLKKTTVIDKEKLDAENIGQVQFSEDNKIIAYLDEYRDSPSRGELVLIKEGYEKVKLASDITDYQFTGMGDYIYFLNEDKSLYMKILSDVEEKPSKKKEQEPTTDPTSLLTLNPTDKIKIDEGVTSFKVSPDGTSIVYIDTDNNLFLKRFAEEKVKVASDISEVSLYNHTILMLNKERSLYTIDLKPDVVVENEEAKNNEGKKEKSKNEENVTPVDLPASPVKDKVKIADLVVQYSTDTSLNYLAYKTTAGEIYSKTKDQPTAIKVIEKESAFSTIHFLDAMLYEKLVTVDQITGSWKATASYEEESYDWFIEITKELKITSYDENGEKLDRAFKFSNPTPTLVDIVFTEDSDDMFKLEVVDKNTLVFHYSNEGEESVANVKRVKKEELDKEIKARKAAADKQRKLEARINAANETAENILYSYLYNTNEGTKVYSSPYDSNEVIGTLGSFTELYILETYVTESGEVWCKSNVYFGDIGMYNDVWFTYNSIT
ncbi:hypothetical protein [Candidatus Pristimantibacillus sp. PTI5]|uniref:hypothetical protein n=1 Tax=Candidatus Pristimantibacillus sp. PTI5 TaxID=3400422 RepID=UPI003B02CBE9